MAIYLIRHGETASNAARIVQTPDTVLSPRGIEQAERLAQRVGRAGITDILSSDLPRAMMTAERLQAATGAALHLDARLQERNFGEVRGSAYADLPVDLFAADYAPPGGESWGAFHARIDGLWPDIASAATRVAGHLAVVTHGLVCYSLALRHLALPAGVAVPMRWDNASLTVIAVSPAWRVTLLNCTTHLGSETYRDPQTLSGA